jgi:hypothetical protein
VSKNIDWDRIETFLGFGRADAPVVFIGMEEGVANEGAQLDDLYARSQFDRVMDIQHAHWGVSDTGRWFGPGKVRSQPTWRPMCDLMLRREGISAPTLADRKHYQVHRLARSDGDTLLTELLPYPHKKSSVWRYSPPLGRFPTRERYRSEILPMRRDLIRRLLAETRRELVVCYGKKEWPEYKWLFEEADWNECQPFQLANVDGTRVILTPHFSRQEFNTIAQLAHFARVALE